MADVQTDAGLSIVTPANWFPVDFDLTDEEIAERVEKGLRGSGHELMGERLVEVFQTAREARGRAGVLYAAGLVDAVGGQPVTAGLTVAAVDLQAVGNGQPDSADAEAIAEFFRGGPEQPAEVSIGQIAGRDAARVEVIRPTDDDPDNKLYSLSVQYYVPLSEGRLMALSFTTPMVGFAKPFSALFDAIASTLRIPESLA